MFKTAITEMFGVKYPIICGAMMWICKPNLCAAISNAGGLEEIIPLVSGERVLKAWETGDVNAAPMMVGQSIGLIHSIPTCAELLKNMMQEAAERVNAIKACMQE